MTSRRGPQSLAIVFAFMFGLLLGGARTAIAETWMPASVGDEWAYRISETSIYTIGGQQVSRLSKSGRYSKEIARQDHLANEPVPIFVFEDVRKWTDGSDDSRTTSLGAMRGGAFLEFGMDAGDGLTMHENPLVYVPASVKGGMTWEVGTLELNGLTVQMQGEILGLQAAKTPAGPFERCLKVRYTGEVSGMIELDDGRLPVRTGQLDMTHWFAPGIGLVMAEESLSMDLLTAEGTMTSRMTDRYALERYRVKGAPVPAQRAP
ncbi:MAG: hypothetical protein GY946_26090 [bacterium]|nr:hypothetical protein [bacterium]